MKKTGLTVILFCGICPLFGWNAKAQQVTQLVDVRKILIDDDQGGLGAYIKLHIEIIPEQGRWNSYELHYEYRQWGENRSGRKLIASIKSEDVALFLKSVAVIKPTMDPRIFGINADELKAEVKAKEPKNMAGPQVSEYITESAIAEAIRSIKDEYGTDDSPYAGIMIVKNNNDTIKVTSWEQNICMQPWKVNGTDSYDMQIGRFFLAALGAEKNYPNRGRIAGVNLKGQIHYYIHDNYAALPMAQYRWYAGYPENLNLLKKNFNITRVGINKYSSACDLQSEHMPPNVFIHAELDMASKPGIEKLLRYRDTVLRALAAGNVVFKYCANKPLSKIVFPYSYDNRSTSYISLQDVQKVLPSIKGINAAKLVNFYIRSPEGDSQWLILPDNKLVLISGVGGFITGLRQQLDEQFGKNSAFVNFHYYQYTLLNADGSMVLPLTSVSK